jgi:hypothetical protein
MPDPPSSPDARAGLRAQAPLPYNDVDNSSQHPRPLAGQRKPQSRVNHRLLHSPLLHDGNVRHGHSRPNCRPIRECYLHDILQPCVTIGGTLDFRDRSRSP